MRADVAVPQKLSGCPAPPLPPAADVVGYARVSTRGQNDDSQVDDLTGCGCEKIFTDTVATTVSFSPTMTA